jgi:hypothetical protein
MQSMAAVLPGDPPDFMVRVPHGYCDPDQLTADLRAGGLEPGSIDRMVLRGTSASARTIAQGFCLGTPLRFALQERGSLEELTTALEDEMVARLGAGPVESDLAAFLVTAHPPA